MYLIFSQRAASLVRRPFIVLRIKAGIVFP
jgi:hypothetical protein